MAAYSLSLAAVLGATALHHHTHRPARAMQRDGPVSPRDIASVTFHEDRGDLHTFEKQLTRLRRRMRRLRMKTTLERRVVMKQLREADAQLVRAKRKYNAERVDVVRYISGRNSLDHIFHVPEHLRVLEEPVAAVAFQRLEDEISKKKLLLRASLHESIVVVDVHAVVALLRFQVDELKTQHHEQLCLLYEGLAKKRLGLRALYRLIKKVRICKREGLTDPNAIASVLTQDHHQHHGLACALATKLRLHDDANDVSMAKVEDQNGTLESDEDDTRYDADIDEDDACMAYEEASI